MDGYATIQQHLQTNMVFRARRNNGEGPFERASELWYPPAHFVGRGRFNAARQPMFYVANRFRAAVFEMRPQVGDIFSVLAVQKRRPLEVIVCAHIGMERCLAPEVTIGAQGRLLRDHPTMRRLFAEKGFASRWLAIDRYLGDIATAECGPGDEGDFYKPTNALARVLGAIPGVDVLQYPSVAVGMKAINLCMTPTKADELFSPSEAWMLKIEEHQDKLEGVTAENGGYYAIRFIARSEPIGEHGRLYWRPVGNGLVPNYLFGNPLF